MADRASKSKIMSEIAIEMRKAIIAQTGHLLVLGGPGLPEWLRGGARRLRLVLREFNLLPMEHGLSHDVGRRQGRQRRRRAQ